MASNDSDDEKPNLRPNKRITASGKSLFLHHNLNQPSNKSYISATWKQTNENCLDKQDPFGIEQPHVEYSLNKQQRWEVLNDFRRHLANQSSSSSDNDLNVQSDSEQRQKKKKSQRQNANVHQTKYRLYEYHNTAQKTNCVGITSNTDQQRVQIPRKTYMKGSINTTKSRKHREENEADVEDDDDQTGKAAADVTYYAVVPSPRDKQLASIRKQHGSKAKRITSSTQRTKFTQVKEQLDVVEQLKDEKGQLSTDEDESIASNYTSQKPGHLQLNNFIPVVRIDDDHEICPKPEHSNTINKFDPKSSRIYLDDVDASKQTHKFHRQISKEEKLYNRDMITYLKMQQNNGEIIRPKEKSHHHLMSLSFRSVFLHQTDLTIEYLSKTFGKNFIHAQCYPTKYLICLTDRLKSSQWTNKFDLFSIYSTLNCYLIIILNDETPENENFYRVQVGLNMDLYLDTIEIENLSESIYKIDDLIEKTIEFITMLSFETFKPIDSEINQRKYLKNETDNELSESEFLNKQIRHLQILGKNSSQTKLILEQEQLNNDRTLHDYALIKPEICTNCYRDINETIPMTALKTCAHWLCNHCWKDYLENSIKRIKVILCPEWNCCSVVDVGTILSLVNVRCMNIYDRNIQKSLVNLSRSYVKCPSNSCSHIVQVISPDIDNVRCHCGHQFCIDCKQEPHFPATCNSYRAYIDEVYRNGDLVSGYDARTIVNGRNCVSCNNFIEKNGGCNHMTCQCGAQFCWVCTAYWRDHYTSEGVFGCPKEPVAMQKAIIAKERNPARKLYCNAIYHRHERAFQNQTKRNEYAKRLIGTIPLDKGILFDSTLIKSQVDKREALLRHAYEIVKYVNYLHRICEFIAVAADGYGKTPIEFSNSLYPLETIVFNLNQILEDGRGYKAIEQLNELHKQSEKLIERLRRGVALRRLRQINTTGYVTS